MHIRDSIWPFVKIFTRINNSIPKMEYWYNIWPFVRPEYNQFKHPPNLNIEIIDNIWPFVRPEYNPFTTSSQLEYWDNRGPFVKIYTAPFAKPFNSNIVYGRLQKIFHCSKIISSKNEYCDNIWPFVNIFKTKNAQF